MGSSFDYSLAGPGSPAGRIENHQSPKLREEQTLEKHEELTEKQQARDLVSGSTLYDTIVDFLQEN
jgi:hypothetical protein